MMLNQIHTSFLYLYFFFHAFLCSPSLIHGLLLAVMMRNRSALHTTVLVYPYIHSAKITELFFKSCFSEMLPGQFLTNKK